MKNRIDIQIKYVAWVQTDNKVQSQVWDHVRYQIGDHLVINQVREQLVDQLLDDLELN